MSPKEFLIEMEKINQMTDIEERHKEADVLMAKVLMDLGYKDGVDVYKRMKKWYS